MKTVNIIIILIFIFIFIAHVYYRGTNYDSLFIFKKIDFSLIKLVEYKSDCKLNLSSEKLVKCEKDCKDKSLKYNEDFENYTQKLISGLQFNFLNELFYKLRVLFLSLLFILIWLNMKKPYFRTRFYHIVLAISSLIISVAIVVFFALVNSKSAQLSTNAISFFIDQEKWVLLHNQFIDSLPFFRKPPYWIFYQILFELYLLLLLSIFLKLNRKEVI